MRKEIKPVDYLKGPRESERNAELVLHPQGRKNSFHPQTWKRPPEHDKNILMWGWNTQGPWSGRWSCGVSNASGRENGCGGDSNSIIDRVHRSVSLLFDGVRLGSPNLPSPLGHSGGCMRTKCKLSFPKWLLACSFMSREWADATMLAFSRSPASDHPFLLCVHSSLMKQERSFPVSAFWSSHLSHPTSAAASSKMCLLVPPGYSRLVSPFGDLPSHFQMRVLLEHRTEPAWLEMTCCHITLIFGSSGVFCSARDK